MTQVADDKAFQSRMAQLEELLQRVQAIADPVARDLTAQIIQTMMEYHGAAIGAVLERVADAGELGQAIIDDFGNDDLIGSLLLLYGLHPLGLEDRVRQGLEKVRPYLKSHGGNVELLGITDSGAVRLRMQGSCHGCPSSAATLKNSIEQAIYDKAPDVAAIEVEGAEEPAADHNGNGHGRDGHGGNGFVPADQLFASIGKKHKKQALSGVNHVSS
ncbi:MAG TPA: NifU family protein [Tepidisphaeraceae bacterium]|jgi:Fe-S cluster biogenesis protein NfuA|nr:NifU family protein [Tepidisphaeraceae bacterium]